MPEFEKSKGFKLKSGNKTTFKMMGSSPLTDKIPESGTGKDDETGTYYYHGMAQKDLDTGYGYSDKEAEAAEQLGSRRVDRAHRKHERKAKKPHKHGQKLRNKIKTKQTKKAHDRAEELTAERFAKTEQLGKDEYNRLIERENKRRKDRAAAKK